MEQIIKLKSDIIQQMGSGASKKNVAIIDDNFEFTSLSDLVSDERFSCTYYSSFDTFLEQQNFAKISNIIVSVKEEEEHSFNSHDSKFRSANSVKYRLLNYIKKYSEERLSVYILVKNIYNYKLPEEQVPYITLAADKIDKIKNHILDFGYKKQEGTKNIKLRRMIRDMYRKINVKIIDQNYKQNKKLDQVDEIKSMIDNFEKNSVSYEFSQSIKEFDKTTMSTYCEYLICYSYNVMEVIDYKKSSEAEYRIIVITKQNEKIQPEKESSVWLVDENLDSVIQKMLNCSNIKMSQKPINSENIIFFGISNFYQKHYQQIKKQVIQVIASKNKIKTSSLKFAKSYEELIELVKYDVYSYIVSFESTFELDHLKKVIQSQGYEKRVHLFALLPKVYDQKYMINEKIKYMDKEANFQIKFEIAPIQTISVFQPQPFLIKFLTNKMGYKVDSIESIQTFREKYVNHYWKIIDSYHLICTYNDFKDYIKEIFIQQKQKSTYFNKVKIIILDDKKLIERYEEEEKFQQVVLAQYQLHYVQNYLQYSQSQKVSMPFFGKGKLSRFHEAQDIMNYSQSKGLLSLNCSLISRNQLFKEVFQNDFTVHKDYKVNFVKFPNNHIYLDQQTNFYEKEFISAYSSLWTIGYSIINPENLSLLKDDIKNCFFKCKNYQLLKVSDDQFQYFYINKIDECENLFDLQITCIYIYSLPHGLNQLLSDIFRRPNKTILVIKIFCHFLTVLMTSFCSFDDQVMNFQSLVLYLDDQSLNQNLNKFNQRDLLYNVGFLNCFRNQDVEENANNHTVILQIQNVPFLVKSRVKKILEVERFSFYKESTQFIVAPYTKFEVKEIKFNSDGKFEIRLLGLDFKQTKSFVEGIFQANGITQELLSKQIKRQIEEIDKKQNKYQQKIFKEESLYKKAQLVSLNQQKNKLKESIKKGLLYQDFFKAHAERKYVTAQQCIFKKIQYRGINQKKQIDIQNHYINQMLGIERALIYFQLSRYKDSINSIKKVQKYLQDQKIQDSHTWKTKKLQYIRLHVEQTYQKRIKILNDVPKTKKWTFQPIIKDNKIQYVFRPHKQKWVVDYHPGPQKFSLSRITDPLKIKTMVSAYPERQFGESVLAFTGGKLYDYLDRSIYYKNPDKVCAQLVEKIQGQSLNNSIKKNTEVERSQKTEENIKLYKKGLQKQQFQNKSYESQRQKIKSNRIKHTNSQMDIIIEPPKDKIREEVQSLDLQSNQANIMSNIFQQIDHKDYRSQKVIWENNIKQPNKQQELKKVSEIQNNSVDLKQTNVVGVKDKQIGKQIMQMGLRENLQVFQLERKANITKIMNWQVFFFDGKYQLVQKQKHFKAKVHLGHKHHLQNFIQSHQSKEKLTADTKGFKPDRNGFII